MADESVTLHILDASVARVLSVYGAANMDEFKDVLIDEIKARVRVAEKQAAILAINDPQPVDVSKFPPPPEQPGQGE